MGENLPFIPRQMDEAGLTPAQFRVVCRVSRRGVCNESIENMARGCRLAVNTLKTVLPFLVLHNVLSKEKRTGQTSIYRVRPTDQWQIEPSPNGTPGQTATQLAPGVLSEWLFTRPVLMRLKSCVLDRPEYGSRWPARGSLV